MMKKLNISKRLPLLAGLAFVIVAAIIAGYILVSGGLLKKPEVLENVLAPQATPLIPEKLKVLQAKTTLDSGGSVTEVLAGHERELKYGDILSTDLNGIAELVYPSGSIVRVGQNSKLTFTDADTVTSDLGKLYVRFKKLLGVQEKFEVESTNAIAAVRGTAFASIIKPGVDQRILVTEDEVEVTPKDKDGKLLESEKKIVKKGEQAVISKTKFIVTVAVQKLTTEEKEWLEFNQKADEISDSASLIKNYLSLLTKTPTPVPTPGTPKPTAVPLVTVSSMPGGGYTKSSVVTSVGTFPLACYGANRTSIRMLTDSASDQDCVDNCPVLPLDQYATRNGGVAAINGMYFCPADYPSCAGKINTFDTLFFNSRTKQYMNSSNNIYSNIPFVGMNSDHSVVFVGSSSQWGRDTGIIGGTAGNPMLMQGGNYAVNEAVLDDKQRSVKSNRGAIALEGDMLYLCIVQGATVPDAGRVFQTLGADNAINIDGGGSSALWVGGSYKYGPGRQIPTAIILAP